LVSAVAVGSLVAAAALLVGVSTISWFVASWAASCAVASW